MVTIINKNNIKKFNQKKLLEQEKFMLNFFKIEKKGRSKYGL